MDKVEMTQDQVECLKKSFVVLAADLEAVTDDFYDRMFERDPRLRFIFPDEMAEVKLHMSSMFGYVLRRISQFEEVEPRLRNLGIRHGAYGVRDHDYGTFKEAMLETIKSKLQLSPEDPTLNAWSLAFDSIARAMMPATQ